MDVASELSPSYDAGTMILLVAGDAEIRQVIVRLVTARRYQITGLECGDEVLKRLRFRPASLVILDCSVSDSFEILAKIRAEHHSLSTPVIMFSTDDQNLSEQALLRGADGYVPKGSLDWMELLAEIERIVGPPQAPEAY